MFYFFNTELKSELDTLELHYQFTDQSHAMDASVETRCTYEALGIIRELAQYLQVEIETVETEPFGEGGLRRWLRVVLKEENKKGAITAGVIAGLFLLIMQLPVHILEKGIDKWFEDREMNDLQKQKIKEEIKKLKRENEVADAEDNKTADFNAAVKKRRSNFYDSLNRYEKVDQLTLTSTEATHTYHSPEKTIKRSEFGNFIMQSDDITPVTVEGAHIEIIAPVLKKGNYKWIGIYQGEPIQFSMKSEEFKTDVQNGKVEFKNGASIKCNLQIKRKITNEGIVVNCGYKVLLVSEYYLNDKPFETVEGKKQRQRKEAKENQLDLWGGRLEDDED